jgi:hypothetical protein
MPALVVAIADASADSIAAAEAASQAFGSTRGGCSCRALNAAAVRVASGAVTTHREQCGVRPKDA